MVALYHLGALHILGFLGNQDGSRHNLEQLLARLTYGSPIQAAYGLWCNTCSRHSLSPPIFGVPHTLGLVRQQRTGAWPHAWTREILPHIIAVWGLE